jgi:hypothetical protein
MKRAALAMLPIVVGYWEFRTIWVTGCQRSELWTVDTCSYRPWSLRSWPPSFSERHLSVLSLPELDSRLVRFPYSRRILNERN